MEIAELKLKVIEKLTTVENKETLISILEQLQKVDDEESSRYNLSQHFESISKRYDSTLKKLAQ